MTMPLISVIMPAYNVQDFVVESCKSVFLQTYPNWELVVIDDGSTDHTLEILNKLAKSNDNMTVIHTENRGVSAARNAGLNIAKGSYISFLDADDQLTSRALEILYNRLQETESQIAIGDAGNFEVWEGMQALIYSLENHLSCHSACGKLYKADLVQDIRFVEERKINEDIFFIFQCFLQQPKVATTTANVYSVRKRFGSASRSDFSEKYLDILFFAEKRKRIIEEQYPVLAYLTEDLLVKAHITLLRVLCRTYDPQWREQEKKSLSMIQQKRHTYQTKNESDKRFLWIISHGLFPLYKIRVYCKRRMKAIWYTLRKYEHKKTN